MIISNNFDIICINVCCIDTRIDQLSKINQYFFLKNNEWQIEFDRWLCYCHVPTYCNSLPHYETSAIFGRTFLRLIYSTVQRQLVERFQAEKDRLPPERRDMILNYFPKFLADMELELGNDSSPVWDPSYNHRPPVLNEKGIQNNDHLYLTSLWYLY